METNNFDLTNEIYFLFCSLNNSQDDSLEKKMAVFLTENESNGVSREYIFSTLLNAFERGNAMGVEITDKTTLRLCNEWLNKNKNSETPELTFKGKRPENTHSQQFALLEELGIIEFLKNEFNLPDIKMSELIANIINRDVQNTRVMLSNTANKESESKKNKNKEFIRAILIKTGAIKLDK